MFEEGFANFEEFFTSILHEGLHLGVGHVLLDIRSAHLFVVGWVAKGVSKAQALNCSLEGWLLKLHENYLSWF